MLCNHHGRAESTSAPALAAVPPPSAPPGSAIHIEPHKWSPRPRIKPHPTNLPPPKLRATRAPGLARRASVSRVHQCRSSLLHRPLSLISIPLLLQTIRLTAACKSTPCLTRTTRPRAAQCPAHHCLHADPHQLGGSILPSINQGFHDAVNSQRDSRDSIALSLESRRSSIDSRMHVGMNNLYIHGATSPYESANTSQVSLAASLRRPNGHGTPVSRPAVRNGSVRSSQPRVAPPIIGRVPGAPDPTAAKPTQGYAWAFPDSAIPEERDISDSDDSDTGMSRQNSYAASSIRSSIFSNDSRMPPGQRRLDEGVYILKGNASAESGRNTDFICRTWYYSPPLHATPRDPELAERTRKSRELAITAELPNYALVTS